MAVGFCTNPLADDADTLTYAELDLAARRIAALLQRDFAVGERVLLLYPPGLGFTTAFIGCLYAGVVPAAAPLPDGQNHRGDRLREMIRGVEASGLLTEESALADLTTWAGADPAAPPIVVTDRPDGLPDANAWTDPGVGPDHTAFLQFTSGSTSRPCGVVVHHHNIVDNAEHFRSFTGCGQATRFGGWLPMYHDFGLLCMFLFPLYYGASAVHMSPAAFLRRPHSWFRLIDRFDIGFSPSPNFGYDHCVRRITEEQAAGTDLSRWERAFVGAEPVRAATLRAFAERFADLGFRPEALAPGYGLAEATVAVSCDASDQAPTVVRVDPERLEKGEFHPLAADEPGRELVCCGDARVPGADMELRIVDPAGRRVLGEGAVGEIWLRGSSVTHGYLGRDDADRETFDAVTADGEPGFLRTGDLAAVHGGRLYITGRIKEVVIYHGRNLYPHDLEAAVGAADPLLEGGNGAAFMVPGPEGAEELVVVQEARLRGAGAERVAALFSRIHDALFREFGVALGATVLVRPGGVKRTTSGKIQRLAMRSAFRQGALKPAAVQISPGLRELVPAFPAPPSQEAR